MDELQTLSWEPSGQSVLLGDLVQISTSKFFKDNKIAWARSLWIIYKCLLHQIAREIMLLLANNVGDKTSQKVRTEKILKAFARYM